MAMIDPLEAEAAFRQLVPAPGVGGLSADSAIAMMIAFYRAVHLNGCNFDEDGDMLLFQWGVYDHIDSKAFTYDITRQLTFPLPPLDGPHEASHLDPEMCQLSLTLHFAPTESLRACGAGNRWCSSPDELPDFESFIRDCPATAAVRGLQPVSVDLTFTPV